MSKRKEKEKDLSNFTHLPSKQQKISDFWKRSRSTVTPTNNLRFSPATNTSEDNENASNPKSSSTTVSKIPKTVSNPCNNMDFKDEETESAASVNSKFVTAPDDITPIGEKITTSVSKIPKTVPNPCNNMNFEDEETESAASVNSKFVTAPEDITPIGEKFSSENHIRKLQGVKFPYTSNVKSRRCFQLKWLHKYPWLEYSISRDAVFCNVCRQFGTNLKDHTFTIDGFRSWKHALSSAKGFPKHSESEGHVNATAKKIELSQREKTNTSVLTLINDKTLEKRRYYVSTIIKTIRFLVANELALRGNWDSEENEESSLFNNLFKYTLEIDSELVKCQNVMPLNATYTSPLIQNEIITIMAKMLRDNIVEEIKKSDVDFFTILLDGTKDKNGVEILSLAARYVSKGKPHEVLLFFEECEDSDADAFTKLLITSVEEYGLNPFSIINQCYDGAAVMKGYKSGVAKRLQDRLQKVIPYVHCFNHRLHLVIIEVVKNIEAGNAFFENLKLIYTIFKKPRIRKIYEGKTVKRLIETRWTGHILASTVTLENYEEIVATLTQVRHGSSLRFDAEEIATSIGLLEAITRKEFIFMLLFMNDALKILAPADKIFQKREMSYRQAMPIITAIDATLEEFRKIDKFDEYNQKAEDLLKTVVLLLKTNRRVRQRSIRLADSVIMETIGERSDEDSIIMSSFFEVIDVMRAELERRFTENNDILLACSDASVMDLDKLQPLKKVGIILPDNAVFSVAKKFVETKRAEWLLVEAERRSEGFNILSAFYDYRDAFPQTYKMFAAIETFGCSTAICESSFSVVSRINVPSRLSMTTQRMRNLAFLAFENKRLEKIPVSHILKAFDSQKSRRVQLF